MRSHAVRTARAEAESPAWRSAPPRARIWDGLVMMSLVAMPAVFLAGGPVAGVLEHSEGLLSGAAILAALRIYRPQRRLPWLMLAAGTLSFAFGDLAYHAQGLAGWFPSFSVGDGLYAAAYPFFALALIRFGAVREGSTRARRMLYVDSTAVFLGALVLLWFFLLYKPYDDAAMPMPARVMGVAFPLADLGLLALMGRLLLTARAELRSFQLLTLGIVLGMAGDLVWREVPEFTTTHATLVAALYYVCYAALAATALHPSMPALTTLPGSDEESVQLRRLVLLSTASLSLPIVFLSGYGRLDGLDDRIVFGLGAIAIPLLTLYRFTDLVRVARSWAEHARRAFDDAAIGMAIIAPDGTLIRANAELCDVLGCSESELEGRLLRELAHPDDLETRGGLAEGIRSGELARFDTESRYLDAAGNVIWLQETASAVRDADGELLYVVDQMQDVSRRKLAEQERDRLESDLRLAQKLESVGQLAAGVAHEINTPMQFVNDSTRFLAEGITDLLGLIGRYRPLLEAAGAEITAEAAEAERDADLSYLQERLPEAVRRTFDGVERVVTIVRAMKDFAHPPQTAKAPADINSALETTLTMAQHEVKHIADVDAQLGDLPPVVCLIGDLNQVFLNLIINGTQAIAEAERERGTIRVATRRCGPTVEIEIGDDGCGIPPEIQERIFDPFFTTKGVGSGTGQGLTIARSIVVDRHQGKLAVRSEPGLGTTFTITLPIDGAAQRPLSQAA